MSTVRVKYFLCHGAPVSLFDDIITVNGKDIVPFGQQFNVKLLNAINDKFEEHAAY